VTGPIIMGFVFARSSVYEDDSLGVVLIFLHHWQSHQSLTQIAFGLTIANQSSDWSTTSKRICICDFVAYSTASEFSFLGSGSVFNAFASGGNSVWT